jgi:hypothetical protein
LHCSVHSFIKGVKPYICIVLFIRSWPQNGHAEEIYSYQVS